MSSTTPSPDVARFLAQWPRPVQNQLDVLRSAILAAAPEAVEGISYGVPVYKLGGKPVVFFGAAAQHATLHMVGPAFFQAHPAAVKGYKLGVGSIQFPHDKPIPVALVMRLVKLRLAMMQDVARDMGGRAAKKR